MSAHGWRDIKSAPKDGTAILLYEGGDMVVAHWRDLYGYGRGEWYTGYDCADEGAYTVARPAYWHPLPTRPQP